MRLVKLGFFFWFIVSVEISVASWKLGEGVNPSGAFECSVHETFLLHGYGRRKPSPDTRIVVISVGTSQLRK